MEFFVRGVPAPKGSATAMQGKVIGPPCAKCHQPRRGRPFVIPANKKTKPWEKLMRGAAMVAMAKDGKITGPVSVTLVFYMPRPAKHYLTAGLRDNAPYWHEIRPDLDKLERSVLDALTDFVFEDDCKVVSLLGSKIYATGGSKDDPSGKSGVHIKIESCGI